MFSFGFGKIQIHWEKVDLLGFQLTPNGIKAMDLRIGWNWNQLKFWWDQWTKWSDLFLDWNKSASWSNKGSMLRVLAVKSKLSKRFNYVLRTRGSNRTYSGRIHKWVDETLPFQFKVKHAPGRTPGCINVCLQALINYSKWSRESKESLE